MITLRGAVPLAAVLVSWLASCGGGAADSGPPAVPPDMSGLTIRHLGGLDVRYGADQATVASGDLDEDGVVDLAVALHSADAVAVFLGGGAGTFETGGEVATGRGPWKVAMGDLDGDGHLDLVTANRKAGSVSVLPGNGDGTFRPRSDVVTGTPGGWVEVADLDADGHADLVVSPAPFEYGGLVLRGLQAAGDVVVLRGLGDGSFDPATQVATGVGLGMFAAGDLDGDLRADLVVADPAANGVRVLLGEGDGTFVPGQTFASGPDPRALALGDLDGDGLLDAVVADFATDVLGVLLGRGDGTFAARVDYQVPRAPSSVSIADLDGDDAADVVLSSVTAIDLTFLRPAQRLSVLFGGGDGGFRGEIHTLAIAHPYSAAIADLDADGRLEVAVVSLDYLDYFPYPDPFFQLSLHRVESGAPLTVSPPRARGVTPGGIPISFSASAGGAALDVDWSLSSAVGTLSAASGAGVIYTPPAAPVPQAAVSLVASSGAESVSIPIGLSAQVARPLGSTSAPNGFLEYLPPGYDDGVPRPLLVFLQGVAGNGNGTTDLTAHLSTWAIPAMISYGAWPAHWPFIVLSPQHVGSGCPSAAEVHAFIAWAIAHYRVDPGSVYLTGLSCGADAAWDYIGTYLDAEVAAVVLVAGNPGSAFARAGCQLGRVATWALHGELDAPAAVQAVMSQLAACPAPPRRDVVFTLVPGGSHYIFDDVYLGRLGHDVFAWLLAHPKP